MGRGKFQSIRARTDPLLQPALLPPRFQLQHLPVVDPVPPPVNADASANVYMMLATIMPVTLAFFDYMFFGYFSSYLSSPSTLPVRVNEEESYPIVNVDNIFSYAILGSTNINLEDRIASSGSIIGDGFEIEKIFHNDTVPPINEGYMATTRRWQHSLPTFFGLPPVTTSSTEQLLSNQSRRIIIENTAEPQPPRNKQVKLKKLAKMQKIVENLLNTQSLLSEEDGNRFQKVLICYQKEITECQKRVDKLSTQDIVYLQKKALALQAAPVCGLQDLTVTHNSSKASSGFFHSVDTMRGITATPMIAPLCNISFLH